ncbi:hypothetical protein Tco_1125552 [Tanacetum coccineum]|uniref:Uncharacterized protein n=1 Tax=Tanacetum coccineum TaxID=301880 RepID=A0ABQ5JC52_9ASTR
MTKVIKGEFEKIKDIKFEDDSLACNSPLKVFNCEVSRLSKMDDDLFTYEVEIGNIPCDLRVDDDSEHKADDMGFDPSDISFTECCLVGVVRRRYVDGGSSSEVIYENCFRNLGPVTNEKLRESRKPLVGFSGEVNYPLGVIDLSVTMGEQDRILTVAMNLRMGAPKGGSAREEPPEEAELPLPLEQKPIRRIHQGRYGVSVPALTKDHKRNEDQYAVSRGLNTPYSRYGINIIFWKISNVVPTPRNLQYAVSNTWIRRIQPTSRPYK